MSRFGLWGERLGLLFAGYLIAVLAASAAFVLSIAIVGSITGIGSLSRVDPLKMLVTIPFVSIFIAPSALPGFVLAITAAAVQGWKEPLPYTLAGGLNGVVSLLILAFSRFQFSLGFLPMSTIAGLVGGFVFHRICGRSLGSWQEGSS